MKNNNNNDDLDFENFDFDAKANNFYDNNNNNDLDLENFDFDSYNPYETSKLVEKEGVKYWLKKNDSYSSVQINTTYSTGDTITGGIELNTGLINQQGGAVTLSSATDFNSQLGKTVLGVSDVVTLCMYIPGNTKVYAHLVGLNQFR